MSDNKNVANVPKGGQLDVDSNIAVSSSAVSNTSGSVNTLKTTQRMTSSSDRQIKFERAQKALENAARVSKRIKEHRKATAELLGRPFEEDEAGDTASEMASTISEKTGYSVATDTSTTLSVKEALNIPGISESLANTLKQKELLMERIKQYKEISKRPSLIKSSPVSKKDSASDSKMDVKMVTENAELGQLLNAVKEKENMLSVMQVKMKAMETTILDLQEKINEKDQIIEAKNMATTLMSDSLSKKEKDSMVLLEDTRLQMTKMQENFVSMEAEWKEEKQRLLKEIEIQNEKIKNLEEANTILENSRFEISVAHAKLSEELDLKNKEIMNLQEKIHELNQTQIETVSSKEKDDSEIEKGSIEISNMVELTKKIELLEQLNCQIRQTNKELENKLALMTEQKVTATNSPIKKGSPLPSRKGKNVSKMKSPWSNLSSESLPLETEKKPPKNEISKLEMLIKSLNKDILEKEYLISQKDALISELQSSILEKEATIQAFKSSQTESSSETVDIGIITEIEEEKEKLKSVDGDNLVKIQELEEQLKSTQQQIETLNNEVDTANKNMIKVKSNHKTKVKQMQKTIDNFSKVSDANAEIVKLNEELHQLSQKVAELEEEKGNLQLHLVDYDSGRLTESEIYQKLVEMENLAETRLKAISVLETQKFDLVQELHVLQQKYVEMEDKLADMSQFQNEQVCSEMKSVQLEEQIDKLIASKKELELRIDNLKLDNDHLSATIKVLQEEKEEIFQKLENYIQENIELTDKLEKLSAEKVSSAESIEIVESLTTQEKLELEEYNKGKVGDPAIEEFKETGPEDKEKTIENLMKQSTELSNKIELFTQERQEVMEKMNKIGAENESLIRRIEELKDQCIGLQSNIDLLTNEKIELQNQNETLTSQIEELKRERLEIMKESVEICKPNITDEPIETSSELHHDEKLTGEKARSKSVKQLTKEILKLKNVIKEREAEIADCQMKILSLEEYQQKQNELMQTNTVIEAKMKTILDENQQLKGKINVLEDDQRMKTELQQLKNAHETVTHELHRVREEYTNTINLRDNRINELENLLTEYEKQILNYGNTLQQKDKELVDYMNQVTKLNDVSQKLKSTIDLMEIEKSQDQNTELVKSLNKQISSYQKKLAENEEKLRILEDEKLELLNLKSAFETKVNTFDIEMKNMQETLTEKQTLVKELQTRQQKHTEEMSNAKLQVMERDEEIHEIKIQLRKESIENEKLRTTLTEKETILEGLISENEEKLNKLLSERDQLKEQYEAVETKNKELVEKLKKFAINIKKKSSMYTDLENQLNDTQRQLESRNVHIEQLLIQVETLPALQEKVKHAEEEINRVQAQKHSIEQQKTAEIIRLGTEITTLEKKLAQANEEMFNLKDSVNNLHKELQNTQEENFKYKNQVDFLQNKLVEYEIEQKNNLNLVTKVSSLESDLHQKQQYITELINKLETCEQQLNQIKFGQEAKLQERDLYIESLEAEINKYKLRICRLEESISVMEDRRHSLERKADQLDSQLQEKHKAYNEYLSQEDELINRLAVLMDHDRVVEKQLHEIEIDNKELLYRIQNLCDENQRLRKALSDIQDHCNTLEEKANRTDLAEAEKTKCQSQLHDLETNLKRLTHEHQTLLVQRKKDIEDLEMEFNTQIENAFKEKKALSEKYEKISDHVSQLELKLQEYRSNIENLTLNLEELNKTNQELIEKSTGNDKALPSPDYTEQYINEINNLNSIINSKNQELNELHNNIQTIQNNNVASLSSMNSQISELETTLQNNFIQIDQLNLELNNMKKQNQQLQNELLSKDETIKELKEKKKVTFEMNIPKTEGMVISSTIEAVSEEPKSFDMTSLESQIVSDTHLELGNNNPALKISEYFQSKPVAYVDAPNKSVEPLIVPKKTYLCYKEDDINVEHDPFNSDEGWGLGESEQTDYAVPGFSHSNEQIVQLKKEIDALKSDLETSNTKLLKALKKLKELKANNDMLSHELKLAKQISQSSFIDTAIEDELRNTVKELEKTVEELNTDLLKEKKEKEVIKKQNEVFNNANDRLTEIKEKMDSEIELWKFKFKEVNDKLSSLQWDAKDSPVHKITAVSPIVTDAEIKEEMSKLEKENDELQLLVEQLTSQNKELLMKQTQMTNEIGNLKSQIQCTSQCEHCADLNNTVMELRDKNIKLINDNELIRHDVQVLEERCNELSQSYEELKSIKAKMQSDLENRILVLSETCQMLEKDIQSLTTSENEANEKVINLKFQINELKTQYQNELASCKLQNVDSVLLSEKYKAMEQQCLLLNDRLEEAYSKIQQLDSLNKELVKKSETFDDMRNQYQQQSKAYEDQINESNEKLKTLIENEKEMSVILDCNREHQITELNAKIMQLNTENDQLLSTVTELRSSIASAVDQRGFEISELWKQHLAQREEDFQKTEQELRTELSAAETKYEQLLDSVQSSSQEETNKLIIIEQVNSLQMKLQDKEDHIQNLQDKYAEVMNQLDMMRSEIEDEKIMLENKMLVQQDEYEKLIHELRSQNQLTVEQYEESLKKSYSELTETKSENETLIQEIEGANAKVKELEQKITELSTELQIKDSQIYQKRLEFTHILTEKNEEFENVRRQLIEYEKKIEDITYEKESELAILRLKLHESNDSYEKSLKEFEAEKLSLTEALNSKIVECTNLNKIIAELNLSLEEHANRSAEMREVLENQEVEIVTLKDEIIHLQKMMRISSSKIEKHVTFASDTKPGLDAEKPEEDVNKELLDAVPRAELDLALYMLHQRDVRCEELTMELTQLLEERDTLQLRLSDSLRSNEELKARCKAAGLEEHLSSSQETVSELPTFTVEKEQHFVDIHRGQTSRSSSISDPDGDKPKLQAKLSELRSVKHSRDIRLRQESEQRQLDLRLLQRDVANLPPEAIDQLAQAHHTLSRDSQSTSTVLLNWLRGKSTPKVVHM